MLEFFSSCVCKSFKYFILVYWHFAKNYLMTFSEDSAESSSGTETRSKPAGSSGEPISVGKVLATPAVRRIAAEHKVMYCYYLFMEFFLLIVCFKVIKFFKGQP